MTYTTQELIQILDRELQASWQGDRILLSAQDRLKDPVLTTILGSKKISKVYAYREFREQVHQYQQQYQVSGLVWRQCSFQGKTFRYQELHNQLIAIPQDKATLIAAKAAVFDFWQQTTAGMRFWRARKTPSPISAAEVEELTNSAEWAEVEATRNELYLGLCWGNPAECHYQRSFPDSGCNRLLAAQTEPRSLKLMVSW